MRDKLQDSAWMYILYGLSLGTLGGLSPFIIVFGLLVLLLRLPLAILITVCGVLATILWQHGSIEAWLKIIVVEIYKHDFSLKNFLLSLYR